MLILFRTRLTRSDIERFVNITGHVILTFCRAVAALTRLCRMLSGGAANSNFIVFCLTHLGIEPTPWGGLVNSSIEYRPINLNEFTIEMIMIEECIIKIVTNQHMNVRNK